MRTYVFFTFILISNGLQAQQMGPQFSECSMQQGNSAGGSQNNTMSGSERQITQLEDEIADIESDIEKYENKNERLLTQLENYFSPEVYGFVVKTHMEKMNLCEDYKTYPAHDCQAGTKETQTICGGKDDVPDILKSKWITASGSGLCTAQSSSSRGAISFAVCDDVSLRSVSRRSANSRECVRVLTDYGKYKNQIDKLNTKKEKLETKISALEMKAEIADRRSSRLDAGGLSRESSGSPRGGADLRVETEAPCEECAMMGRNGPGGGSGNRSTLFDNMGQILAGLGLIWLGSDVQKNYYQQQANQGLPPYYQQNSSNNYAPGIAVLAGAFNQRQQNPCGGQATGQMGGTSAYGNSSIYQQQLEYAQLQNRLNGMSTSPSYNLQSIYSGYSGR